MNAAASKSPPKSVAVSPWLRAVGGSVLATALVFAALAAAGIDVAGLVARAHFHLRAPDFALLGRQPVVLRLHIGAALTALAIGIVIMARPKGVGLHKTLGWSWVIAMATTAVSSLFLRGLNGDGFSLIHLLSGWVIVALPVGVWAIRSRKVNMHRRMMTGLFVGGLLVAGGLTFIPGRLMWAVFFG